MWSVRVHWSTCLSLFTHPLGGSNTSEAVPSSLPSTLLTCPWHSWDPPSSLDLHSSPRWRAHIQRQDWIAHDQYRLFTTDSDWTTAYDWDSTDRHCSRTLTCKCHSTAQRCASVRACVCVCVCVRHLFVWRGAHYHPTLEERAAPQAGYESAPPPPPPPAGLTLEKCSFYIFLHN